MRTIRTRLGSKGERFFDRIKVKHQKQAGSITLGAIRVHELLEESEASDPLCR